ncbi:RNA polymerase II mediator complex subunit [Komagataella phaffii CBS 7435]|uniref:Mediator of RNA polymerase II transcription subunit 14 n=2 Tax=Komagataella phaffii TaxID=460519 RepID=C4R1T5_KOMPG|nr:Subunit of the RNA polymerase II mediator complex [Komagataella phaffii GS115]AOA62606.1 GQ67_00875T0 [Komagataella phaffii]CAH2448002.1 RNA polymerase II mediator complex subunit [Komagataella phaffii CBS 7435]AOA67669.1 GQ68_00514T0 [Komagataella phaffii GS115]CAY69459.1 Subunit of the RNA polymerase II mediator complex [Komagataella phaffii GS115]CCA38158.1 RNA polymerase II mediator complex subunit [Komagataella phaffii CBS 7435]
MISEVTDNIIPLKQILSTYCLHVYKELGESIKILQSNQDDHSKKKRFLEVLVTIRENFVRLFVLSKWAKSADDIYKLIKLFAHLRRLILEIGNVAHGMKFMGLSLIDAKLPNPDLRTAIEVVLKGRPQLKTYGFLQSKKLSSVLILRTIKEVNVILASRISMAKELPFLLRNYKVANGRITFHVSNFFETSLSIGDENENQLYMVYFHFNFGSLDNKLMTMTTHLDEGTQNLLFKKANRALRVDFVPVEQTNEDDSETKLPRHKSLTESLQRLCRLLCKFSVGYKLYLLYRQLVTLKVNIWKSDLSPVYYPDKNKIILTYWNQRNLRKPTIEISVSDNDTLSFEWFKGGILQKADGIKLADKAGTISMESLLMQITYKHVKQIIDHIVLQFDELLLDRSKVITYYTNDSIVFSLTPTKSTIYSIDPLSGLGYFTNPSSNKMVEIEDLINIDPQSTTRNLLRIKLETQLYELSYTMNSTGWISNDIVTLSTAEMKRLSINTKLFNLMNSSFNDSSLLLYKLKFYRRKQWPGGWFLIVGVNGFSSKIQWWLSYIKSVMGQWSIQWFEEIHVSVADYDYSMLLDLSNMTTEKLVSNLLMEELRNNYNTKVFVVDNKDHDRVLLSLSSEIKKHLPAKGPLLVLDNHSLTAIPSCESTILISLDVSTLDVLKLFVLGKLTDLPSHRMFDSLTENYRTANFATFSSKENCLFFRTYQEISFPVHSSLISTNLLGDSLHLIHQFTEMINLLSLTDQQAAIKALDVTLSKVKFEVGNEIYGKEHVSFLREGDSVSLVLSKTSPHRFCLPQMESMIQNRTKTMPLSTKINHLINYMQVTFSLVNFVNHLEKDLSSEVESHLQWTRFMYDINWFSLIYWSNAFQKPGKNQNLKLKRKVTLNIQIKNWTAVPTLVKTFINVNKEDLDSGGLESLEKIFKGENDKFNSKVKNCELRFLNVGIACSINFAHHILQELHHHIISELSPSSIR